VVERGRELTDRAPNASAARRLERDGIDFFLVVVLSLLVGVEGVAVML